MAAAAAVAVEELAMAADGIFDVAPDVEEGEVGAVAAVAATTSTAVLADFFTFLSTARWIYKRLFCCWLPYQILSIQSTEVN